MHISQVSINLEGYRAAMRRTGPKVFQYYEVEGDVARIFLNRANGLLVTLVDADEIQRLRDLDVRLTVHCGCKTYYACAQLGPPSCWGKRHFVGLHRIITNCPVGMVVDHLNHDGLDNRRVNLRIVTQLENARNRSPQSHPTVKLLERLKRKKTQGLENLWVEPSFRLTHLAGKMYSDVVGE